MTADEIQRRALETAPTTVLIEPEAFIQKEMLNERTGPVSDPDAVQTPVSMPESEETPVSMLEPAAMPESTSEPANILESGTEPVIRIIGTSIGKPQSGTVLEGRYRLLKKLGSGGTAEVFLAQHLSLGNMWAIKVLPITDDTLQEHLNEAGILKRLNHPMLPRIADIISTTSHVFIVMDYLLGSNLLERLEISDRIPESDVRIWMMQICDVLIYLHGQQPEPVIYRDLKPSNLISDGHGHLKLIDFGTARTYRAGREGDTEYIGTQGYASPEQYGLKQSDGRTDIYNLGMTMFHLLTGIHPITVPHGEISARLHESAVSEFLSSILLRCVQLSPGNRYPDAQSCREALMAVESPVFNQYDATPCNATPSNAEKSIGMQRPNHNQSGFAKKSHMVFSGLLGTRQQPAKPERFQISSHARIAVIGACPGTGATFSCITVSSWLSARHYETAYVELNKSGDMVRLQGMLALTGHLEPDAASAAGKCFFRFRQVDYHMDCKRMTDIRDHRYDVSVADMGAHCNAQVLDEFMRSDWQLVYCPQADWKFGRIAEFIEKYDPDGNEKHFQYLIPQDGEGDLTSLRVLFGKRRVYAFPHIRNPFILTKEEDRQLERMFHKMGLQ